MNHDAALNVAIITIFLSSTAITISLITFITNYLWKKYDIHLTKKEIIRKGLDNFNRQISDDYLVVVKEGNKNVDDLFFLMTTNFKKNKSSLVLVLVLVMEKILQDKKVNESIFWCKFCSNFYKAEGIKLIYTIIDLPNYGKKTLDNFLNSIKDNWIMIEPFKELFETKEWEYVYLLLFNFSIDLFYLRDSLNEFIVTNFYDINNFNFINWLNSKTNSIKYKEYLTYIDSFIKAFDNPISNKELKTFFKISRTENPLNKGTFIVEQEFLDIKNIFKWYKTQLPLERKEILKKKNKIAFSISRCHFCIFQNLGIYDILTKDKLNEINDIVETKVPLNLSDVIIDKKLASRVVKERLLDKVLKKDSETSKSKRDLELKTFKAAKLSIQDSPVLNEEKTRKSVRQVEITVESEPKINLSDVIKDKTVASSVTKETLIDKVLEKNSKANVSKRDLEVKMFKKAKPGIQGLAIIAVVRTSKFIGEVEITVESEPKINLSDAVQEITVC